jgi:hypothetical protein
MNTVRQSATSQANPRGGRNARAKDEVYRQMFWLEEGRAGAELDLALALLHAWQVIDSSPANTKERDWGKKISPICLAMIETLFIKGDPRHACNE